MGRMTLLIGLAGILTIASAGLAAVQTVDFAGFQHGEVIATSSDPNNPDDVNVGISGLTFSVSVLNLRGAPHAAVIFDSSEHHGNSAKNDDPDLEGPPWATGNLAPDTTLGNLLIIQESKDNAKLLTDNNSNGQVDIGDIVDADDEASRPAGYFDFFFDKAIKSFGFDLVDVEGSAEHNDAFFITMFDDSGNAIADHTIDFADLKTDHQSDILWGNNSANRIDLKSIEDWTASGNTSSFGETTRIRIGLGGSGAIDNLKFEFADGPPPSTTPIPSPSALLAGLGGMAMMIARRRRDAA